MTDLCIFEPDRTTSEMSVVSIQPGVTRANIDANTGWQVKYASEVVETRAPTAHELAVLRELLARTRRAHEGS